MQLAFKFSDKSHPIKSNIIDFFIPDKIYSLVQDTIDLYYPDISFPNIKISKSMKKTLGTYNVKKHEITLSYNLVIFGEFIEIKSVVLHELAHTFTFYEYGKFTPSHGKEFRLICKKLNILPRSYVDVKIHKWKRKFMFYIECINCNKNIIRRSKLSHLFCDCGMEIFPNKWREIVVSKNFHKNESPVWIRL
ncbi:MAG: SprT-like domain-containing protein [Dehalococcoidia bacterium]